MCYLSYNDLYKIVILKPCNDNEWTIVKEEQIDPPYRDTFLNDKHCV
jgi:hypothetical protein